MDFWFWEYIKSKVYTLSQQILSDLKDSMKRETTNIPPFKVRLDALSTVS